MAITTGNPREEGDGDVRPEAPVTDGAVRPEAPVTDGAVRPEAPVSDGAVRPEAPVSDGTVRPEAPVSDGTVRPEAPVSDGALKGFTNAQRDAIRGTAPLTTVLAGPGSGKTRVLVERVTGSVLAGRLDLARVLAITFTENAANQMKTRLAEEFEKRGREDQRRTVEQAYISTIHGFCSHFLRENALEAGVDPRFAVLDEIRAEVLKQATVDAVLAEWHQREPEAFLEFQKHFGDEYDRALLRLYDTVRRLGCDPGKETDLLPPAADTGGDAAAEQHRRAVAAVLMRLHSAYQARKRALSALDFDDLEGIAHRTLDQNQALAARLGRRFQEILVDEYQDTSPLQDKIIRLLARHSRLFVVGDAAQSIYGFRNARPEAIGELWREAASCHGQVPLRKDFRSRPEIIRAVNWYFEPRFRSAETPFDPLEADSEFDPKAIPSVELLLVGCASGKADDTRPFEARHLARRIHELVESQALRITNRRREPRGQGAEGTAGAAGALFPQKTEKSYGQPIDYGDIAILFRSTRDIFLYERALEDLRIPYFSETGRGFYAAREVRDVICFLQVLANSRNEVALAAVLSSPMFRVSDAALFLLADHAHQVPNGVLADALPSAGTIPGLPAEDLAGIRRFAEILERLRGEGAWRSLSEAVREIVRATACDTTLLLEMNGRRKVANLHKLAEVAASLEAAGFDSLKNFIGAVDRFRFEEVREGEAQLDSSAKGAVRLMTMHAAKGLEFPVVILPDLSRGKPGGGAAAGFLPGLGIGVKFDGGGGAEKTERLDDIREQLKQREETEKQRLLFVAMTRAQEHLILSGCLNRIKKGFSARFSLKDICSSLGVGLPVAVSPEPRLLTVGKGDEAFQVRLVATDEELGEEQWNPARLPVSRRYRTALENGSPLDLPYTPADQAAAARLIEAALAPRPQADRSDFIASATDIALWHACPRRYYLGRYLGYDSPLGTAFRSPEAGEEPDTESPDAAGNDEPVVSRRDFGIAVHKILAGDEGALDALPESQRAEARRLAEAFHSSPYGQRTAQGDVRRELPIIAKLGDRFLRGNVDLLQFENGAPSLLLDYKTDKVDEAGVAELAEHYRPQMLVYARLIEAVFGACPREAVLFFLAPGAARTIGLTAEAVAEAEKLLEQFFEAQRTCTFPERPGEQCRRCHFRGTLCLAAPA